MKDLLLVLFAVAVMGCIMFIDVIAAHFVLTVWVLLGIIVAAVMLNDDSSEKIEE